MFAATGRDALNAGAAALFALTAAVELGAVLLWGAVPFCKGNVGAFAEAAGADCLINADLQIESARSTPSALRHGNVASLAPVVGLVVQLTLTCAAALNASTSNGRASR